ncbi:MAG: hypothetical protein RSD67_04370 [Oscillospiraceae bacterium]
MGDKNIKKETKKMKKSDKKPSTTLSSSAAVSVEPELIKKPKKIK